MDPPRCAVVTGASSGIGAAFARALAGRGTCCVLVARDAARLASVVADLPPSRAETLACDVSAEGSAGEALAAAGRRGWVPDVIVLNAGFGLYGPLHEASPERLASLVDVNCRAVALWTRAFLPVLLARGRGGFILVASTAALLPVPCYSVYGATKAFVVSLGRSLSAELAGTGVRTLTVCPGPVATGFFAVAGAPGPLGRPGGGADSPERVAAEALAAWEAGRRIHVVGRRNRVMLLASRAVPGHLLDGAARAALAAGGRRAERGRRRPT